jgi:GT2 family glycosyltransferase
MRGWLLRSLYRIFPFSLQGDGTCALPQAQMRISCIINFYGRLDLLSGILNSLASQRYPREKFEVVLVEDQGGTDAGKELIQTFTGILDAVYLPLDVNYGKMGYSRNFGLNRARGELILFLDDDTVILQENFLAELDRIFAENESMDAVVPHGHASFSCLLDHYDHHDPWFMTSRCTAYRRDVLCELGGFMNHFVGQEDVEFVTRFAMAGKKSLNTDVLHYYHPPMLVPNLRKPKAVGSSFYHLLGRYPFFIWLLLILNCARHAPLYLVPVRKCREMGRFGLGFGLGVLMSPFKKGGYRYG